MPVLAQDRVVVIIVWKSIGGPCWNMPKVSIVMY